MTRLLPLFISFFIFISFFLQTPSYSENPSSAKKSKIKWSQPGSDYKWIPTWINNYPLTEPRGSATAVTANGFIYVMGGGGMVDGKSIIHSSVEFAKIYPDGSLGKWNLTSPMKTRRVFAASITVNGSIYVLGGEKGYEKDELLSSVERAEILPDGSLGPWVIEKEKMNTPRRGLTSGYYKERIYAFGGFNGSFLNDMEQVELNRDGSLGKWVYEKQSATSERYVHSGLINKNFVYLFGGHVRMPEIGTETAEWATINNEGMIGPWARLPPMPTKRFGGDTVTLNTNVYVIGGHNTIPLSSVDRASILPNGKLDNWVQDSPMPDSRVGGAIAASDNVIYVIGGSNEGEYLRSTLRAYHIDGKPLGLWSNDKILLSNSGFDKDVLPLDATKHFIRGWKNMTEKRYDDAIIEYKLGIQVKDGLPQPYNMLATAFHEKKEYEMAVQYYKKAISLESSFGPFYFNLGNTYLEMKNLKEAEAMFRESIRLNPDFINGSVRLLQILSDNGRCSEVKPELMKLMKKNPTNTFLKKIASKCNFTYDEKKG